MESVKKAAVEMRYIIKKVLYHVPESFLWHNIFLTALLTIATLHDRTAIQTIFFNPLRNMRQRKIFLKNKYKNIQALNLFRY